jgi:hypothetical protein
MRIRSRAYRPALLASVALPALIAASAHAAECQNLTWSKDQLAKFDTVLASGQDAAGHRNPQAIQNTEIDAAIASLEQDLATRKGDTAAKGEAALKELRAARDADRARAKQPAVHIMSTAAADVSRSPGDSANALWVKVDTYLDAVNADVSTRQAAAQTRFIGN